MEARDRIRQFSGVFAFIQWAGNILQTDVSMNSLYRPFIPPLLFTYDDFVYVFKMMDFLYFFPFSSFSHPVKTNILV